MRQLTDEDIARKKKKKVSKHYTILVNGEKQKILNYKIRPAFKNKEERILELISKFKFANISPDYITTVIIDKDEKLIFEGTYYCAVLSLGNYQLLIKLKS
jgi:hypothetical protein